MRILWGKRCRSRGTGVVAMSRCELRRNHTGHHRAHIGFEWAL